MGGFPDVAAWDVLQSRARAEGFRPKFKVLTAANSAYQTRRILLHRPDAESITIERGLPRVPTSNSKLPATERPPLPWYVVAVIAGFVIIKEK